MVNMWSWVRQDRQRRQWVFAILEVYVASIMTDDDLQPVYLLDAPIPPRFVVH